MTWNKWFNLSGLSSLLCKIRIIRASTLLVRNRGDNVGKVLGSSEPSVTVHCDLLQSSGVRPSLFCGWGLSRQGARLRLYSYWMEFKSKFQGNFPEAQLLFREDGILIGLQKTSMPCFPLLLNLRSPNGLDYKSKLAQWAYTGPAGKYRWGNKSPSPHHLVITFFTYLPSCCTPVYLVEILHIHNPTFC